jgi:hypothetical protein
MRYYIISYDLIDNKDYEKIRMAIDYVSIDWVRPLLSFFVIKTNWERKPIFHHLIKATDKDDKIFLVECDIDTWLSVNVSQQAVDRLHTWRM